MVKMCDGLPLGIITLAGSMRGETAIHAWRNALTELKKSFMGQDEMEDQVYKVLKYSFDRLLPNHQGKRSGYTKFSFASCIALYILRIESSRNQMDGDSVRMHDLMRAMALKITEGKTMVIAGDCSLKEILNEEEWCEDLEVLSLIQNSIEVVPFEMSPNCPKLSRLLLRESPLNYLPGSFFSRMHALCTLDLSRTHITDLPDSLSDLTSMKALLLGECRELAEVPELGKLKALRELDLSFSGIRKVPRGIEKLFNLKRLLLNGANYLRTLPTGMLLNLSNLQLLLLPYQIQTPVEEIARLKQLEEFAGPVENARDFTHFLRSRSRAQGTFYSIQVRLAYDRFSRRRNQVIFHLCENHAAMPAEDILEFHHCDGLSNSLADDLSRLDDPRSLKLLKIYNTRGIECLFTHEQIMVSKKSESPFASVEKILLQDLHDFMGLIHRQETGAAEVFAPPTFAPAAFSSLKYLTICKCNKMKNLGLPASEFPNLEIITVQYCDELQEMIETGDGTRRGEAVASFVSLPRLRQLYLIRLPKLTSILVEESYNRLPPPSLEEIWIPEEERDWWESLEWEHPIQSHLIQPFLRFWD